MAPTLARYKIDFNLAILFSHLPTILANLRSELLSMTLQIPLVNNPAPRRIIVASIIIAHWLLCLSTVLHVLYAQRLVKRVTGLRACSVR
jgi:hypothetical protein